MATCGSAGGSIVNYIINNTNGDAVFVIRQENTNGPGETQQNTDLTLYGYKAQNWGEKFNENFYRLIENFAAPSRRGIHTVLPDIVDFSYPHNKPATEDDIGVPGTGINAPVNGQLWFNTSSTQLYIYDSASNVWHLVGPACSPKSGFGGAIEYVDSGFGGSEESRIDVACSGFGGGIR